MVSIIMYVHSAGKMERKIIRMLLDKLIYRRAMGLQFSADVAVDT